MIGEAPTRPGYLGAQPLSSPRRQGRRGGPAGSRVPGQTSAGGGGGQARGARRGAVHHDRTAPTARPRGLCRRVGRGPPRGGRVMVTFRRLGGRGEVSSGVRTRGWGYKYGGGVGDSPIIGAGNYCDSRYGAAACTGYGELAIRRVTAKTAVDRLAAGRGVEAVARAAVADASALEDAAFNIVLLSARAGHAGATNLAGRRYVWMTTRMSAPR